MSIGGGQAGGAGELGLAAPGPAALVLDVDAPVDLVEPLAAADDLVAAGGAVTEEDLAGALVILLLSEMTHRSGRPGWRTTFRTVLFLAVPLVIATGFFGGAMVYGIHEYDWNPPHRTRGAGDGKGQPGEVMTSPDEHGVVSVSMTDDDVFKPASITIPAGTTVRWKNASKDEHTVTDDPRAASDAKDVSMPAGARPFNSGKIKPGGTFEQKFTLPGTYRYVCEPHEEMDMKGQVVVKPTP